jgi:hypothetical protein
VAEKRRFASVRGLGESRVVMDWMFDKITKDQSAARRALEVKLQQQQKTIESMKRALASYGYVEPEAKKRSGYKIQPSLSSVGGTGVMNTNPARTTALKHTRDKLDLLSELDGIVGGSSSKHVSIAASTGAHKSLVPKKPALDSNLHKLKKKREDGTKGSSSSGSMPVADASMMSVDPNATMVADESQYVYNDHDDDHEDEEEEANENDDDDDDEDDEDDYEFGSDLDETFYPDEEEDSDYSDGESIRRRAPTNKRAAAVPAPSKGRGRARARTSNESSSNENDDRRHSTNNMSDRGDGDGVREHADNDNDNDEDASQQSTSSSDDDSDANDDDSWDSDRAKSRKMTGAARATKGAQLGGKHPRLQRPRQRAPSVYQHTRASDLPDWSYKHIP